MSRAGDVDAGLSVGRARGRTFERGGRERRADERLPGRFAKVAAGSGGREEGEGVHRRQRDDKLRRVLQSSTRIWATVVPDPVRAGRENLAAQVTGRLWSSEPIIARESRQACGPAMVAKTAV